MKITILKDNEYEEIEVIIKCLELNKEVENLIDRIENKSKVLLVKKDNASYQIPIKDIYYIDAVDEKTFIYQENNIYESKKRLYEYEILLQDSDFIRVNKSCILNINKILQVKALFNGRYEALLLNKEKVIISRHYVKGFKNKFGV